jgi:hypothetical protein
MQQSADFYSQFRRASEERWQNISIQPQIRGYQIQPGTRWNSGLSEDDLARYEREVDIRFPPELCAFLREMNGTDKPALDIRGSSGEEPRLGPAFYSYPRDIELIKGRINSAWAEPEQLRDTLSAEGFQLEKNAKLLPIYSHRYVVCSPTKESCAVLSIWDASDSIVYADSLPNYLKREVFEESVWNS